jgi:hypothetical protein
VIGLPYAQRLLEAFEMLDMDTRLGKVQAYVQLQPFLGQRHIRA